MQPVFDRAPEPKSLVWIDGAEHFFQGTPASPRAKLDQMQAALRHWIATTFHLSPLTA